MLISLSVGVGLKYMNEGSKSISEEHFMFQSRVVLEDVLQILKTSQELTQVVSAVELSTFLLTSEVIPFESNGVQVIIKLSSARSKINPNTLKDIKPLNSFKNYLIKRGINPIYASFLLDTMSGNKEDQTYQTEIFNQDPIMFRDYISSIKHLEAINTLYVNTYHDSNFQNIDTSEIFYTSKDRNSSIDLNFARAATYEIILGCDTLRAEELSLDERVLESLDDLALSEEEKINIANFQTSFYEPYLDVNIEIIQKDQNAKIRFEYNIKSQKGSHFVFEV